MAKVVGSPDEPVATSIYRGYLLSLPSYVDQSVVTSATYQERHSSDNSYFSDWADLATTFKTTNFNTIHDALYTNVYYQYRYRLLYTDGTYSDWSDYLIAGAGKISTTNDYSSLDQLAASLGTITSGFLRGVVFETSANYPKVRMDPTGFYAISSTATPVFISASTGAATFSGLVTGSAILGSSFQTATPNNARILIDSGHLVQFDSSNNQRFAFDSSGFTFKDSSGTKTGTLDFGGHLTWYNPTGTYPTWGQIQWDDSTGANIRTRIFSTTGSSKNTISSQAHVADQSTSQAEIIATSGTLISGNNYGQLAVNYDGSLYNAYCRAGTYTYTFLASDGTTAVFLNNTNNARLGAWSYFSLAYDLTGISTATSTVTFSSNLPSSWWVVGHTSGIGSGFNAPGIISWGITAQPAANQITVQVGNWASGLRSAGTLYCIVFGSPAL